MFSELPLT